MGFQIRLLPSGRVFPAEAHESLLEAALRAGIASAVNLLDVEAVIIGGGLGVRFGEPYVKRIRKAMAPHLFNDEHPPALHVAALGDFGGATGAALLAASRAKASDGKASRRRAPKPAAAVVGDGDSGGP